MGCLPPLTRPRKMRGDKITVPGLKTISIHKMIIREYYEVYATTFNNKFLEKTQTSKDSVFYCWNTNYHKFSLPFISLWFYVSEI